MKGVVFTDQLKTAPCTEQASRPRSPPGIAPEVVQAGLGADVQSAST